MELLMRARPQSISLLFLLVCIAPSAFALPPLLRKAFVWEYEGNPHELQVDLPTSAYLHYRALPRSWAYGNYVSEVDGHPVMAAFANALDEAATLATDSEWEKVRFAVAFVQHLRYTQDVGGEYPRYPIETLVDGGGDCEDTAILLAAILDAWGIDCVLLSPPGHMALGLAAKGAKGTYYPFRDRQYYYVETTGKNWEIGFVPPQYAGKANVIELKTVPGPRRIVEYVAPAPSRLDQLQFAVYRYETGTSASGRPAFTYKVRVEGNPDMLATIQEVRYQRQHTTFPEYREGAWLRKVNPEESFELGWTAWRQASIAVQVKFKNGNTAEFMIEEAAIDDAD